MVVEEGMSPGAGKRDRNGMGIAVRGVGLVLILTAGPAMAGSRPGGNSQGLGIPPPTPEAVAWFGLDPFYRKQVSVAGLPILGSERVNDTALLEAGEIIGRMLSGEKGRKIIGAMISNRMRVAVMAFSEVTTDIPEHRDLSPGDYWDYRARGLGATRVRPAVTCGEENLLNRSKDRYTGENILIHEFAHGIHEMGLRYIDSTFEPALGDAYDKAMKTGLWKGTYSSANEAEYWAEGVQSWFNANTSQPGSAPGQDQHSALASYDPDLAALIGKIFETPWRYWMYAARAPGSYAPDGTRHAYDTARYPAYPVKQSINASVDLDTADRAVVRAILDANGFTGVDPNSVVGKNRAGRVTGLNLSRRKLSVMPGVVGRLTAMKSLNLHECGLETLPPEIGRLGALTLLILSRNALSSLPPEIGSLANLNELVLSGNQLEALPEEVANLRRVWMLMANYNRLSRLPARLGEISSLSILSLDNNQLTSLPESMIGLQPTSHFLVDANALCALPRDIENWVSSFSFDEQWKGTQRCPGSAQPAARGLEAFGFTVDPAAGRLTVFFPGSDRDGAISVFDMRGARVEGALRFEEGRMTWTARPGTHGIFQARVMAGGRRETRRIAILMR